MKSQTQASGDTRVQAILRKRSAEMYSSMRRRANKDYAYGELPFNLAVLRVWLEQKFSKDGVSACEYSGKRILVEDFSLDHREPISRGGGFELSNLALVSLEENLRKGNMTAVEYLGLRKYVEFSLPPGVREDFWKRLEIGDVQRYSHFRRLNKAKKGSR